MVKEYETLVYLENINYNYDSFHLKNINLEIKSKKSYYIYGPCGSGKTTLGKIICGLLKPCSGKIIINCLNPSMILQNIDNQFVRSVVSDDLAFGPENLGMGKNDINNKISYYSKLLKIESLLNRNISSLSSVEKIKVAICGIMCTESPVIVMDEVFSYMDYEQISFIYDLEEKCIDNNKAVIILTHNKNYLRKTDDVFMLKDGILCL